MPGLAATAVAVGVAVALTLPGQGGPPTAPVLVNRQAAAFLDNAASVALHQTGVVPDPRKFIYSESVTQGHRSDEQSWLSVTGERPGLISNGGNHVLRPCSVAEAEKGGCATTAGYLPDFPTEPDRVHSYLVKIGVVPEGGGPGGGTSANWQANDVGDAIDVLLLTTYLMPAQRAALYEFMARTPGFYPVPHAVDATGRHGFGIGWNYQGSPAMIIFNPRTFAFLGDRTGQGKQYDGVALIKFAIVGKIGQT